jgi:quinol monooxygenase YgiN
MQAKLAVFGILRFPPDRLAALRSHLKSFVETTRRQDGCLAYDVAEDPFDPGLIRFAELWPDAESLERHLRASHVEPWRQAARACGLMERQFTAYDVSGARPV